MRHRWSEHGDRIEQRAPRDDLRDAERADELAQVGAAIASRHAGCRTACGRGASRSASASATTSVARCRSSSTQPLVRTVAVASAAFAGPHRRAPSECRRGVMPRVGVDRHAVRRAIASPRYFAPVPLRWRRSASAAPRSARTARAQQHAAHVDRDARAMRRARASICSRSVDSDGSRDPPRG